MRKGILISAVASLLLLGGCSSSEQPSETTKKVEKEVKPEKQEVNTEQLAKRAIRSVQQEKYDQARTYIEKGADINIVSRGTTILVEAVRNGNVEFIEYLLTKDVEFDFEDESGNTYLMMAKDAKVAELLLDAGLDPNKSNSKGRKIILDVAASSEKIDVLQVLVNSGADLDVQNVRGNTALMVSIMENNKVGAKLLIKSGADLNIQNNKGDTALMKATDPEIIMELIEAGANLKIDNNKGANVGEETFMLAVYKGYKNVIEKLIEKEMGVNFEDSYGETPLELAKSQGNEEIIEMLKKAGAKE
ncbi:MAG: ankyrin repeat domain-containing protein [Fusobacteriota bacterium]